jgi:hypothetical protein
VNKEHKNLSWFKLILRGNSPTFSGLILIKIYVTKGEHAESSTSSRVKVWISYRHLKASLFF